MKTRFPIYLVGLVLVATLHLLSSSALAQGTAFTYQGRLTDNGRPVNGLYDVRFTIHDLPASGNLLGGPVTNSPTLVSDGLFSVLLDFGSGIFTGGERWIEMSVRANGSGSFVLLQPRQQISATPYALSAREVTGSVAAAQLTGTIQSANIGAGAILSPMLADGIIHSNHLGIGSVHSNILAPGSVTAAALVDGSIHSNHLASGSVHSNALVIGSIHSNHLAVGSVHSNALALGSVTAFALADESIHSNHLALASVHSNALALGSVTAAALADGIIHSNHFAIGSVHSNILALGSVTAAALADGSIHSNHLAVGSVHSNALVIGSVHSNALALGSVTAAALADGAIHSNHLALASVHSNALALGSVTATALADGIIHSNHFAIGSVHSNILAFGSVTAAALADGSIHSNHLAVGSVHSNALVIGSVHSNALALGSVTSFALADGSIHSNHFSIGSVHSNALALGSVTETALAVGSIHSNHLAVGSVHSNALAFGSVTATALAVGSIHSNHLAAGSVDATALVVGAIHSNHLAVGAVSLDKITTSLNGSYSVSITNPTPGFFDYFGGAVAGLGNDKLIVGAYQDSTSWDNGGAAYLMSANGALIKTFLSPSPQNQEHFGFAVAAVGPDKVLIGADGNSTGGFGSGAAYLFSTNGTLITVFANPTPAISDSFGYAVAAVGTDKVLIGAHGDHFGANIGGAAYLFSTSGTLLMTFNNPTPASGDRFGVSVAAMGDDKVLIGADRDDTGAVDAGAAYLFNINGWLLATFNNPTPATGDAFGAAIASVGNQVVIGAPADSSNGNAGGAVYLFNANGSLSMTWTNPTPASGDSFGSALATVGATGVLIGATGDDTDATDAGIAYLFNLDGSILTTFHNPAPASGDAFGNAVAALGTDQLVVGAWRDDTGSTDTGLVHLWRLVSFIPSLMADTVRAGAVTTSTLNDGAVTLEKLDPNIGTWTRAGNDIYRASGKVGVGTASPLTTLHVSGNNSQLVLQDSFRGNSWHIYTENHPNASISGNLLFYPGPTGGMYGFIQRSSGNYFSSSDARLKKDVQTLSGVLDRLLQLRPVSYRFKSAPEGGEPVLGFIAQEVEPLFPEVVGEHDGMKSLAYSALVPVAVGAIQELHQKFDDGSKKTEARNLKSDARIQKLEAENAELRHSVDDLKKLVDALAQKLDGGKR